MSRWPRVLLWLLAVKVVYLTAVYGALCLWADMDVAMFYRVMRHWPREGGPVFASHFATWDGAHYLYLSEVGYAKGVNSCAFYPLWPLLVRGSSIFTGGSHLIGGLILANGFSLAAWVVLYVVVARRFGEQVAKWTLVFLIAFPGSLFAQFLYSEPVFFLLVVLPWWALEGQRRTWAWLAAALLPLTRGIGVFTLLPIGWHLLSARMPGWAMRLTDRLPWMKKILRLRDPARHEPHESEGSPGDAAVPFPMESGPEGMAKAPVEKQAAASPRQPAVVPPGRLPSGAGKLAALPSLDRRDACVTVASWQWRDSALLAAPLVGWAAYLGLMWHWTGNPFEGIQAQKHWGVHSITNLIDLPKFVVGFFSPTEWHGFRGSVLDRGVFVLLLYCLPVLWRLDKGLLVWAYVLGILPAMSGTFTSFTRFASCAFPLFIALAVALRGEGRGASAASAAASGPWAVLLLLRWVLVAGFAALHLVLLWRFVNFRWAG